jgi:D-3-phosphoglycerate dehydrogenase
MSAAHDRPRVLVADPIAAEGLAVLRAVAEVDVQTGLEAARLSAIVGEYDALVVRSETKVTAPIIEAGKRLRVIARAGVGVDNIDVEAASRRGVVVVNSPTGNIAAAAEHTVALLMAMARHIPAANISLRGGKWERSRFVGTELRGKTLGVVGLGKVGAEVARRCGEGGLGMRVIATDPYAAPETARKLNVELVALDELLPQVDFLTVHTVLNTGTRGLIGAEELATLPSTARVINCARGGVIDEEALLAALEAGALAGAALDVFTQEPPAAGSVARALIEHPLVVATPHLGASTEEAQVNVAVDVAEQVVEILRGGAARSAVNAPLILPETLRQPVSEAHVNLVNAPVLARDWGLEIVESRSTTPEQYVNLVTLSVPADGDTRPVYQLAATITWGEERVVRVDEYATDFVPSGHSLFARNVDRPGMIGRVGTILGDAGVNIGHMDVGPIAAPHGSHAGGGEALMILAVGGPVPPEAIEQIRVTENIFGITSVEL